MLPNYGSVSQGNQGENRRYLERSALHLTRTLSSLPTSLVFVYSRRTPVSNLTLPLGVSVSSVSELENIILGFTVSVSPRILGWSDRDLKDPCLGRPCDHSKIAKIISRPLSPILFIIHERVHQRFAPRENHPLGGSPSQPSPLAPENLRVIDLRRDILGLARKTINPSFLPQTLSGAIKITVSCSSVPPIFPLSPWVTNSSRRYAYRKPPHPKRIRTRAAPQTIAETKATLKTKPSHTQFLITTKKSFVSCEVKGSNRFGP